VDAPEHLCVEGRAPADDMDRARYRIGDFR
jgi:hypothetical protein